MFSFLLILLTSFITQHVTTTNDCSFDTENFIDALPGRGAKPKRRRRRERGAGAAHGRPRPRPGSHRRGPFPAEIRGANPGRAGGRHPPSAGPGAARRGAHGGPGAAGAEPAPGPGGARPPWWDPGRPLGPPPRAGHPGTCSPVTPPLLIDGAGLGSVPPHGAVVTTGGAPGATGRAPRGAPSVCVV